jgi:hypothetical protein
MGRAALDNRLAARGLVRPDHPRSDTVQVDKERAPEPRLARIEVVDRGAGRVGMPSASWCRCGCVTGVATTTIDDEPQWRARRPPTGSVARFVGATLLDGLLAMPSNESVSRSIEAHAASGGLRALLEEDIKQPVPADRLRDHHDSEADAPHARTGRNTITAARCARCAPQTLPARARGRRATGRAALTIEWCGGAQQAMVELMLAEARRRRRRRTEQDEKARSAPMGESARAAGQPIRAR